MILGFSQGACLALEFSARSAAPLAAVVALSGALIGTADADGPPEEALYGHSPKRFEYPGRLDGVPIFLGCHQRDPHIPVARVRASGVTLKAMGAIVTTHIHPGAGHGITDDEVAFVRSLLGA
jgi:predicted esterase